MGSALEVEWGEGGLVAEKGEVKDLDAVIDKAIGISLVEEVDLEGSDYEAVWKVRHSDGNTYYYMIPRKDESHPPA